MDPKDNGNWKSSQEGEGFRTLHRDSHTRLCIVTDGSTINTIELVIDMFPGCPNVDLDGLHEKLQLLRELRSRGYELACDHDSFICAEAEIEESSLESEIEILMEMISTLDRGVH
jgi:hypothetical protein